MKTRRIVSALTLAFVFIVGQAGAVEAAEIQLLCSNGLTAVVEDLIPQFERASGHKLVVKFGLAADFKRQIDAGAPFDVAILTPALVDDLIKNGKAAADSRAVIARTGLGLLIRAGGRKPDVTTTDAFKRSLSATKAIAFAKEGASGVAFTGIMERLAIAEALKNKLRPTATGEEVVKLVAGGEAEFGVLPLSEILGVRGIELGGMFPADIQTYITMAGAVSSAAKQSAAGRELIKFLMSSSALPTIKAKGMERN